MPPTHITRRRLLGYGAVAAGALALPRALPTPWSADRADAAATAADWADLARSVKGTLLMPGDPAYATARLPWNTIYDDVYPQAVLQVADASDVQRAITFCRDTGVNPIPRSGGHSFQGFSNGTGLIIDLSRLDTVQLNKQRTRVRIGAGALLIDIYAHLFQTARMAIAGGTCPLVGISGLTQGGGVGPFSREHGLTLDTMVGASIVTADGRLRYVNHHQDADIFWAIRGGGGRNFGVVTSFDLRPLPADMHLVTVDMTFAWKHAERVMEAFQEWPDALPPSAHPNLVMRTSQQAPGAQPTVTVSLWHRGPRARVNRVIADFIREVGARPTGRSDRVANFFEAEYAEYCQGLTRAQCAPVTVPGGQLPRVGLATYSEISNGPWPQAANDVIIDQLERWQRSQLLQPPGVNANLQAGKLIVEPLSGAVHRTSPTATAFPWRDGWMIYQFQSRVQPGAPADAVAAGQQWVAQLYSRLTPWRTGHEYSNYGNRALRNWGTAYYGQNLARLRSIKAKRDPGNLIRFVQSVKPANPPRR
jgi:FAD/FMN-containing dehydrogenase